MEFRPYDRVLVRNSVDDPWFADFYLGMVDGKYLGTGAITWNLCLPYAGNEALLGTKLDLSKMWIPNKGELVAVRDREHDPWEARIFIKGHNTLRGEGCCRNWDGTEERWWAYIEPLRDHFDIGE